MNFIKCRDIHLSPFDVHRENTMTLRDKNLSTSLSLSICQHEHTKIDRVYDISLSFELCLYLDTNHGRMYTTRNFFAYFSQVEGTFMCMLRSQSGPKILSSSRRSNFSRIDISVNP